MSRTTTSGTATSWGAWEADATFSRVIPVAATGVLAAAAGLVTVTRGRGEGAIGANSLRAPRVTSGASSLSVVTGAVLAAASSVRHSRAGSAWWITTRSISVAGPS